MLEGPITKEEVRVAVFDMSPNKAVGSDELSAHFFQSQWEIVDDSIWRMVGEAFTSGFIPEQLNTTLMVLIPKERKPHHPLSIQAHQLVYSGL